MIPGAEEGRDAASAPPAQPPAAPPPWFRIVVWDSLLAGLAPLLPVPFVDDIAVAAMRRRLVSRLASQAGIRLLPHQLRLLAGGGRGRSCGWLLAAAILYPVKKVLRKLLYFLAVKEAIDTLSLVFHQGYLLHGALARSGFPRDGTPPADAEVERVRQAVFGTLGALDTRPLGRVLRGVFRSSSRLVVGTLRWVGRRLGGRQTLGEIEAAGMDEATLGAGSPAAEALLDRLVTVLWGEQAYRRRLDEALRARLEDRYTSSVAT
ncbi:MAG TPA: hypothetical protein VMT16_07030 [Thermoanaerobaculia bacterium]|nr:hypothetical protein [Thermoanaerobaculia bacterium]